MSKQLQLDVAQLTDVGRKRPHNEDNMAYVIPKDGQVMARKGALFIVADGMGGHAAGEVASEIAVDTVTNAYYQDDTDDIPLSLVNAIRRANALIHQRAAENMLRSGMGTTCVSAVLRGNLVHIANVGDSRAYLVRKGLVRQVSQDHSWVEEQVRAGLLTKEQARSHAQRNVITRSLGTQSEVDVDIFTEAVEEGDTLILCTDGLSGSIHEDDLQTIVNQYFPQESVYHLVERANENGGPDNITAIVVRVKEVGWEQSNARYPVHAGGREAEENTTVLGMPGMPPNGLQGAAARVEDGRVPSGALRLSPTGPLYPYASSAALAAPPKPVVRKKRGRAFYPSLALFILVVVALVSSGIYYFLGLPAQVDQVLTEAGSLIEQAKQQSPENPTEALQKLAQAQRDLRDVQKSTLSTMQSELLNARQTDLTSTFKKALKFYNMQGSIIALPCGPAPQMSLLNNGNTGAKNIINLVSIQDDKGNTFSYVLGSDYSIYQLDEQHKLVSANQGDVALLTSDAQHIFALTKSAAQGNTPSNYTLHIFTAGDGGKLNDAGTTAIGSQAIKDGGWAPAFVTAWKNDIYVILTSKRTLNQAIILNYATDKVGDAPQSITISTSVDLLSVVAEPEKQLFLLYSNGNVQSLKLGTGNNPAPANVSVKNPINVPLMMDVNTFNWKTPIATPIPQATQFLTVPGATTPGAALLVSGLVNSVAHLYIVDNTNHRVVDLLVAPPVANASTVTPTTTATAAPGGHVVDATSIQVVHQYTSATLLASVNSMVVDPKGTQLLFLTQPAGKNPTETVMDATPAATCVPPS